MLDRWHLLLDDATILTSSSEVFKSDNSNHDDLLLLNQKPTIHDDGDGDKQIEDELCDAISQISTVDEIHPEAIYTNRFIHHNYVYTNRDDSSFGEEH
nr:14149_t:CDS:2 [Entrophospora candida]